MCIRDSKLAEREIIKSSVQSYISHTFDISHRQPRCEFRGSAHNVVKRVSTSLITLSLWTQRTLFNEKLTLEENEQDHKWCFHIARGKCINRDISKWDSLDNLTRKQTSNVRVSVNNLNFNLVQKSCKLAKLNS